jgi:hypothetical protein
MIIHLNKSITENQAKDLALKYQATLFENGKFVLVTSFKVKTADEELKKLAYGAPDLARACAAMGVDGLLIETHPNPREAKSDAEQQLSFDEFRKLHSSLKKVTDAVGYHLI